MENPSTLAVRHPRQSVQQSSQLSLISCALTRIKAQRSHSQCHFVIITTSLWLWVQYNVISCKKEARAYTIIDHIPQYPSISKTTETWYTNTCNMPCLPPPCMEFLYFCSMDTSLHHVDEEECGGNVDSVVFIAMNC